MYLPLDLDQFCKIFIPDGLDQLISGINDLPVSCWLNAKARRVGRVCLVLFTDLIIRVGEKLLCQLRETFIWIVLMELDEFLGWRGLDMRICWEIR